MANNFLKQLQKVVETGKLQGVTNIKDLYEHFKDSGINYKDFKKQMHDYGIYGHLGKHDAARLSGMYYGSKKADWEEKKPQNLARERTFAPAPNITIPDNLKLLNIPVTQKTSSNVIVGDPNSGPIYASDTTAAWRDYSTGTDQNPRLVAGNGNGPGTGYSRQDKRGIGPNNTPIYTNDYGQSYIIGSNGQIFNGQLDTETIDRLGLNYYTIPSVYSTINKQNSEYGERFDDLAGRQQQDFFNWRKIHGGKGTVEEYLKSIKPGGSLYTGVGRTTQSFQQGGKTSSQQDAVMQFVQALAQTLQADPQQVIQAAQQNPEALKSAVQVYQETQGDIQKAAQAFSQALQSQAQVARHGAKLNYLKTLKNQCAEDEELYYYKKGGSIGCGCKKKEKGGEIKESVINRFKKDNKISKHQSGKTLPTAPQVEDAYAGGKYVESSVPFLWKLFTNWKQRNSVVGPRNSQIRPRIIHQDIYTNPQRTFDTIYTEIPANDPSQVRVKARTAKSTDEDRTLYDILNRRFNQAKSIVSNKKGGEIKKDCGGSKMKLQKGDKVCPKCGKIHSVGMGCSIAKFKYRKLGGQL